VLRFQRREGMDFQSVIDTLDHGIAETEEVDSVDSLSGIEGSCTRAYFSIFGQMLSGIALWEGRSRRPPKDPVNALLSLGYVLLSNELASLLGALSLDPCIGFLHGMRYGRMSLALDLVEEFRHGLVDILTLNLLGRGSLKEEDFDTSRPEEGVILTDEALKRYFGFYEEKLADTVASPHGDKSTTWRGLLQEQAESLRDAILNGSDYNPFIVG
jgi:CRISPR-associated protein Cas1